MLFSVEATITMIATVLGGMYAQSSIIETQKSKYGLESIIKARPSANTRIFLVLSFLVLVVHVALAIIFYQILS